MNLFFQFSKELSKPFPKFWYRNELNYHILIKKNLIYFSCLAYSEIGKQNKLVKLYQLMYAFSKEYNIKDTGSSCY